MDDRTRFWPFSFGTGVCLVIFFMLMIKAAMVYFIDTLPEEKEFYAPMDDPVIKTENKQENGSSSGWIVWHQYAKEPEISVLITDSSGHSTHEKLQIAGTDGFSITSSAGTDTFSAGDCVNLEDYFTDNQIRSCSISLLSFEKSFDSGKDPMPYTQDQVYDIDETTQKAVVSGIRLVSLKKGGISPAYPGKLLVYRSPEKQVFYLVNCLPMECYLPGVVSSEMPDLFGQEALKTQAVCARSYALSVLEKEKADTAENGAVTWDLIDTTDDQVYMSGPVDGKAVTACRQTRGQILLQDHIPVKPHYYSTSWGQKADGAVFSGEDAKFVKAAAVLGTETDILEMNEEFADTYQALSTGKSDNIPVFDSGSPWFRWTCRISLAELFDRKVQKLIVTQRGTGGYVSDMMAVFSDGTAQEISGAKSIREALGSVENVYNLQNGSTRDGLAILPSAFFYLDPVETVQGVQTVIMHGGGFGHGFGMSQYGAAQMAEEGCDYTEILAYYYDETQLCEYYE